MRLFFISPQDYTYKLTDKSERQEYVMKRLTLLNKILNYYKYYHEKLSGILNQIDKDITVKPIRFADRDMTVEVVNLGLIVSFSDGRATIWPHPKCNDTAGIRKMRDEAVTFAMRKGADQTQIDMLEKALIKAGYNLN